MNDVRLLIADGDGAVRDLLRKQAAANGFRADEAADGIAALKLFRRNGYALILIDAELPELDGMSVCRQIRKISDVPIIALTARGSLEDRLYAFKLGVDDYIVKPFYPLEVMARVRVFLRRCAKEESEPAQRLPISGLYIDTVSRTVAVDEETVQLTPRESDLLFFLFKNPNRAFSREALLDEVWGYDFTGSDRTVDTHIKTLRENIKPYQACIVTVWGYGYKFVIE